MSQSELLDPLEAAEFLGVQKNLLRDWRAAGKGPNYVRFGHRTVRYDKTDLVSFVASRKIKPASRVSR